MSNGKKSKKNSTLVCNEEKMSRFTQSLQLSSPPSSSRNSSSLPHTPQHNNQEDDKPNSFLPFLVRRHSIDSSLDERRKSNDDSISIGRSRYVIPL